MVSFPFDIRDVDQSKNDDVIKHFTGHGDGCVEVGPKKFCLPRSYRNHADGYYNVEIKDDDVWIVTFPRSGTTWTQELIWLVTHDLDFETSKSLNPHEKFPFIEAPVLYSADYTKRIREMNAENAKAIQLIDHMTIPGYETIQGAKPPRHIKSHLPLSLLPPDLLTKAKVVYVARNPKDVAVSYYHHNIGIGIHGYEGTFEKYWQFFKDGLVMYGPQIPHVKEAWELRDNPNLLFLFYEDLIKDLPGGIRKVAAFLNKTLSDEKVTKLAEYLSFDNMKAVTKLSLPVEIKGFFKEFGKDFFRRGKIGGNVEFTEQLNTNADLWVAEQCTLHGVVFPTS